MMGNTQQVQYTTPMQQMRLPAIGIAFSAGGMVGAGKLPMRPIGRPRP